MPNFTEHYNLKKPLQEEFYNIDDHNGNMDIIDAALKELSEDSGVVISAEEPEKGEVWIDTDDESGDGGAVTSVNGKTGDVQLTAADLDAYATGQTYTKTEVNELLKGDLGKYSQHCWVKTGVPIATHTAKWSAKTDTLTIANQAVGTYLALSPTYEITTSNTTGTPQGALVNKREFKWSAPQAYQGSGLNTVEVTDSEGLIDSLSALNTLLNDQSRPYYVQLTPQSADLIEITASTVFSYSNDKFELTKYNLFSLTTTYDNSTVGTSEIIYSDKADAYQEGVNGQGYVYTYLGIPAETLPLPDIEVGSYIGTGTGYYPHDSSTANGVPPTTTVNPIRLTFKKLPKRVFIYTDGWYSSGNVSGKYSYLLENGPRVFNVDELTGVPTKLETNNAQYYQYIYAYVNDNTLYWYVTQTNTSVGGYEEACNESGYRYVWIATY